MNKATQYVAQALATPGLFVGWMATEQARTTSFDEGSICDCALGVFLWLGLECRSGPQRYTVSSPEVIGGFGIYGFIDHPDFKFRKPAANPIHEGIRQDTVAFDAEHFPDWLKTYLAYWDNKTSDRDIGTLWDAPYTTRWQDYVEVFDLITKEAIAA